MAEQAYFINKEKYDTLKQSMNFDQLAIKLPEDKRVIVDWLKVLTSFKDDENNQWAMSYSSISMSTVDGRLSAKIVTGDNVVDINVFSYNQGQKTAIDMALRKATNTNAPFISYKLGDNGVGDFCLVPNIMQHTNFMIFVYGNIVVELDHSDEDREVLSVARYIQAAMEQAVAANPQQQLPARPTFTYTIEPAKPRVGKSFLVKVSPSETPSGWVFDVAEELLTDNMKYDEDVGGGSYKFTVNSAGTDNVIFNLMDKRTLWIYTDTVPLNIE